MPVEDVVSGDVIEAVRFKGDGSDPILVSSHGVKSVSRNGGRLHVQIDEAHTFPAGLMLRVVRTGQYLDGRT